MKLGMAHEREREGLNSMELSLKFGSDGGDPSGRAPSSRILSNPSPFESPPSSWAPPPPAQMKAPSTTPAIAGREKLLSFDRANEVINALVATVNAQQLQIHALQQHQSEQVERIEMSRVVKALSSSVTSLDRRIAVVEEAVKLSCPRPDSIGHVVASNRRAIARSLDVTSSKVSIKDLEKMQEAVQLSINTSHNKLKEECASRETMEKAVDVVSSMSSKLRSVEETVANKVDMTDFEAISLDATVVREKARELQNLLSRLDYLEKEFIDSSSRLVQVEDAAISNANRTVILTETVNGKSEARDFERLDRAVSHIQEKVSTRLARKADLERIEEVLESHGRKVSTLNDAFETASVMAQDAQMGLNDLKKVAVKQPELKLATGGLITSRQFSDALARVKAEVDAKAWVRDTRKLRKEFDALKLEHDNTKMKAALATEFVGWYGAKGEVYENNLNAVDMHLRNLAVQSSTKLEGREPYDDDALQS